MDLSSTEDLERAPDRGTRPIWPIATYVAAFFVVWSLRATVLFSVDETLQSSVARSVYSNVVKLVIWVVPAALYVKLYDRKAPLEYLKLSTIPRARSLLHAALACAVYFAGIVLVESLTSDKNLRSLYDTTPTELLLTVASISVSPVLEEILFRGFLLQEMRERVGFWVADLTTAALFALIHLPHWLWASGFQVRIVIDAVSVFLLGLFLGLLVRLTNSLWPAVAAHILNNVLSFYLRA